MSDKCRSYRDCQGRINCPECDGVLEVIPEINFYCKPVYRP